MKLYLMLSLGIMFCPVFAFSQTTLLFRFTSSGLPDAPDLVIAVYNPQTKELKRYTVKEGQAFFGYQIKGFREKIEEITNPHTGMQEDINRSFISLYNPSNKATLILEYEKPTEVQVSEEALPPPQKPGKT